MSSGPLTRVFSRTPDHDPTRPEPESFSPVEPATRTTLFPARTLKEMPRNPEPARDQGEPRPRFAAGGTQIMSVPDFSHRSASAQVQTQYFSVERLLSRRADLNREQELNRELERDLALLSPESELPLSASDSPPLLASEPSPTKRSKLWLRVGMLGLLAASAAMVFYEPPAQSVPPPSPPPLPSATPVSRAVTPTPPPALPAAAVASKAHATMQRAAADVLAEGRYAEALVLYRQLAENEPDNSAYAEVVQILARRIATKQSSDPH